MPQREDVDVPATPEESKAVADDIFDLEDDEPKAKPGTDSKESTKEEGSEDRHPEEAKDSEDSETGHPSEEDAEGHPQQAEQLLAGRYKTVDDLVKGCNELASQLGITVDWDKYMDRTVEDVVSLYKRLQTDYTKTKTNQAQPDTPNTQLGQQQTPGHPAMPMQQTPQMTPQAPGFGQQAPGQQYPYQATQQDPRDAEIAQLRQQMSNMATYIVQAQQGQQGQQAQPQEEQITPEQFYEKLVNEGPKAVNELMDKRLQQTLQPYVQQFGKLQQYVANLERQRVAERNVNNFLQTKQQEMKEFEREYREKITPEIAAEMKKLLQTNPALALQPGGYGMLYKLARGSVAETSTTHNAMLKRKMAAFIGSRNDAPSQTTPTEEDWLNKQFDL